MGGCSEETNQHLSADSASVLLAGISRHLGDAEADGDLEEEEDVRAAQAVAALCQVHGLQAGLAEKPQHPGLRENLMFSRPRDETLLGRNQEETVYLVRSHLRPLPFLRCSGLSPQVFLEAGSLKVSSFTLRK